MLAGGVLRRMFGRHSKSDSGQHPAAEVDVDERLEQDLDVVEQTIGAYLANPSVTLRDQLRKELEELDNQIDSGDDYANRLFSSGALGYTPNPAIGATSDNSLSRDLPDDVFRAQADLVKAAKQEVRGPTSDTLTDLRAAVATLNAARTAPSAASP